MPFGDGDDREDDMAQLAFEFNGSTMTAAGIGHLAEADLLYLFEQVGAAVAQRCLKRRPVMSSWSLVLDYLKSAMAHQPVEHFRVLYLDKRNALISDEVHAKGTVDHVPVYVREVLKRALELNATALILTHNHPSGDPTPSQADIQMTKQIMDAGKPLNVSVHDHIIVGREGHASLRANEADVRPNPAVWRRHQPRGKTMRLNMPREFYFPKADHLEPIDPEGTDAAVYTYETAGAPYSIGFAGKAAKPAFHYRHRSERERAEHIAGFIAGRKATAEAKAKLKADRKSPHTLKVGDILVSSWGYDQTNIDYYQVTRVPGSQSVEIRQIAANSGGEDGFMTAKCTAAPDQFIGEPMIKRANAGNSVRIASYASAHPWNGKEDRYSWYA